MDPESKLSPCTCDPDTDPGSAFSPYVWIYNLIRTISNTETLFLELKQQVYSQELRTREYYTELAKSETQLILQQERIDILDHLAENRLRQIESTVRQFKEKIAGKDVQIETLIHQLAQIHEQQRLETEKQLRENAYYQNISQLSTWMRQIENDYTSLKKSFRWKIGNIVVRFLEVLLFRRKRPMVTDHLELIFREYRLWLPRIGQGKQDQEYLVALMRQVKNDLFALIDSRRWQFGHTVVSILERLLLKKKRLLAIDHMHSIMDDYLRWMDALKG